MSRGVALARTDAISRAEWLALRRKGIGGSDAAKVLGLSRWGGPLTVYLDKTGILPPDDGEPSEAAYWGTALEDVVAREFARRTGLRVRRRNALCCHPDHPRMIANVDREIVGANKGLECKTVSAYKADEWRGDEVPDAYYLQCQHYMAVMGWESCFIAALIGGQRFVAKEIPRNDEEIRALIEAEMRFWAEHVEAGVPPLPGLGDDVAALYPAQTGEDLLPATEEDLARVGRLVEVRAAMDGLTEEREQIEAHTALKEGARRFLLKRGRAGGKMKEAA